MKNNSDKKDILNTISTILSSSSNLHATIKHAFAVLENNLGLKRAILTLKNPESNEIQIQMAHGLSKSEIEKGRYKVGEGIVGEVFQTGEPMIIPQIEKEPRFLNRTGVRKSLDNTFFICVPLKLGAETIGTLSVDGKYEEEKQFTEDVKLLNFIALLISQSLNFYDLIEKEKNELLQENTKLKNELKEKYQIYHMIGNSGAMHQVYENILKVANSNTTVLIRGESGTGKELVASAIHYQSIRANKPFIRVNCGAIPENLIEAELFGFEKGSFTDAKDTKIGKFEAANGGSLFLDEIGDLSPNLQVKLLRALQEKEIERIGAINPIKINVRVIAATNKNLEQLLKENKFREDLYYRLNVFPVFLPPLRERRSDILLLAEHFLAQYAKENHKTIHRISSLAIDLLISYHWPGNVRELQNCMERAVLLCESDTIKALHLPPSLQRIDVKDVDLESRLSFKELVINFEKEIIIDALKKTKGNISKSANFLQTTDRILNYKIENLNIDKNLFRK